MVHNWPSVGSVITSDMDRAFRCPRAVSATAVYAPLPTINWLTRKPRVKRNINSPQSDCPTRLATRSEVARGPSRCRCLRLLPRIGPWRIDRTSGRSCTESSDDFIPLPIALLIFPSEYRVLRSTRSSREIENARRVALTAPTIRDCLFLRDREVLILENIFPPRA